MKKSSIVNISFAKKPNVLLLIILFISTMINASPSNNILSSSPATVLCADPTVEVDADGQYTFTGNELLQSGIDINTDISFISASPTSVDCEDVGNPVQVTVTAQDGDGNTSTCTSTVTVEDNILPEITCNDITVYIMDGVGTNIDVFEIFEEGADNCPVISYSLTASPQKVTCADIGEIPVTLSVYPFPSNGGQVITCTVTATVVDGLPPSIVCHDITVELDENNGTISITPEDVDGVFAPAFGDYTPSGDNCGLVSFTLDQTDFDCSHIGENTVKLTGVDVSGNTRSCNATVTVVDAAAPTEVICNNPTVAIDANGQYTFTGSDVFQSATDACAVSFVSASPASVGCADVGNTVQVEVTVQDEGGNTANCIASVTVEDNILPVISCNDFTVYLNGGGFAQLLPVDLFENVVDNCGSGFSVTASRENLNCSDIGEIDVTVTATSQPSGNNQVGTCISTVTVVDNVPPLAACHDITVELEDNGQATITPEDLDGEFLNGELFNSFDNCSVSLSIDISSFDCDDIGVHPVTLTATDPSGNSNNCIANVTVADAVAPTEVICNNPTVAIDENGQYTFTSNDVFQSATDACAVSFVSASPASVDCADVGNTIQVEVTVQDEGGNTANCIASVTVEDNISPVLTCKDETLYANANGSVQLSFSNLVESLTDNCAVSVSYNLSPNISDCSYTGDTPVTVTATVNMIGGTQQTLSCISLVSIIDNHKPYALCHDISVALDANGQTTITPEDIDGEIDGNDLWPSFDQCNGTVDLNIDISSFDCNDLGVNTVTLTATDPSGNSDNCTANVTVVEGINLPDGWQSADIGQTSIGNDYAYYSCDQEPQFIITGSGNNAISSTTDNVAFAYYSICGDGTITAKIESVENNGYGGLMIRETTDDGAKQAAVFSNMSNVLRHEVRYATNGLKQVNSFFKPSPIWLRMQRQGDWIFSYYSADGVNFQYVHGVHLPMQSCVEFGLASFTFLPNDQTEAVFSNVSVSGNNGGFSQNNDNTSTPQSHTTVIPQNHNTITPNNLNLFPNPNQGQFSLQMNEPIKEAGTLTIYNHYGQQVYQQLVEAGLSQMELDLGQIPSGVYLLEFRGDTAQPVVKRFTISR